MSNLKQIANNIKASIPTIRVAMANSEVVSMNYSLGAVLQRIFNEGLKTDGTPIGRYDDTRKQTFLTENAKSRLNKKQKTKLSKLEKSDDFKGITYKELRELKGLQTDYVDLQFNGDLFNSIDVGNFDGRPAIGITTEKQAKIAGYHDDKYGLIFTASDDERAAAAESARDYLFKELKRIIGTWS